MLYLLGSVILALCDFLIKLWARTDLKPIGSIDLIPRVLSLHYHENYGAAFGILQDQRVFLVVVTVLTLLVLSAAVLTKRIRGRLLLSAVSLIIAGGVGNMIDRIHLGYVVDYIYFEPINFPIFNLADICVCIGTFLLAIAILKSDRPAGDESAEKELREQDGDS